LDSFFVIYQQISFSGKTINIRFSDKLFKNLILLIYNKQFYIMI